MSTTKRKPLESRLRSVGIRHFDVLIHDQSREWLVQHFRRGATKYPVNVSVLMRNLIWQTRERIQRGDKDAMKELVRTFWYTHVKPTLARSDSLAKGVDQYKQLVGQFVFLVKELKVMKYKDIGFRDDNEAHRKVGANTNIVLFSEKLGHQSFLSEMADKYQISIIALGGQPSVLNVEYFVEQVRQTGVNLQRSFYLFSVVDYDPSGWIVRDAFADDLRLYGIKNIRIHDLIHPDMLKPHEIKMARYPIPTTKNIKRKNRAWHAEVRERDYDNQVYMETKRRGEPVLYGLEAESVSAKRIEAKLREVMVPFLSKSEDLVVAYELRLLAVQLKELFFHKSSF